MQLSHMLMRYDNTMGDPQPSSRKVSKKIFLHAATVCNGFIFLFTHKHLSLSTCSVCTHKGRALLLRASVVLLVFACMINKSRSARSPGAISKSQTGTLFKWNKFVYPQLIGRKLDKLLRRFATRLKTTHSAAVINGWEWKGGSC
jgi:hypothetical protein